MRLGVVADLLSGDLARIRVVLASDPGQSNPVRRALEVLRRFTTPARDAPLAIRIPFCPPLALLWHQSDAPRERTPAQRVHHVVLRESWRERSWLQRAAVVARLALVWIPTNVVVSAWSTALNSRAIRARTGKGIARQLAEQAALLVKYDVRAPWYYTFDLHDDALRGSAEDYLSRTETKGGLFLLIKRYLHERGRRSSLADKWLFYEHCQREGLRTMPVLARAEGGALRFLVGDALPPIDLFVKPTNGRGGVGADWWGWDGESGYRSSSGTRLSREELTRHIAELSKGEPYVVAPRLRSHPDLQDLSNGALSTVRIVTARNEHGACEATDAVFRMAVGNNTVIDNFHAGGLAANVDRVTGELSRATDLGLRPDAGWRDTHPHGGRIVGRKVPFWQETTALVEQAHATFDPRVLIGWDVAILADGPCLIEGNGGPDLDIHQRCSRTPTGRLRGGRPIGLNALQLRDLMGRYADWSRGLALTLLPHTARVLEQEWTTFRPALRSSVQSLHMDAAIARPTQGRSWLRVFRNVNGGGVPRVWQVGGHFEPAAQQFVKRLPARVREQIPGASVVLRLLGFSKGRATPYDHTMRALRELIRLDETFQRSAPRKIVEFPAGATWLAYTDLALHGAMSGQHSLDQAFLIEPSSMSDPNRSSLRILERLTGRRLD